MVHIKLFFNYIYTLSHITNSQLKNTVSKQKSLLSLPPWFLSPPLPSPKAQTAFTLSPSTNSHHHHHHHRIPSPAPPRQPPPTSIPIGPHHRPPSFHSHATRLPCSNRRRTTPLRNDAQLPPCPKSLSRCTASTQRQTPSPPPQSLPPTARSCSTRAITSSRFQPPIATLRFSRRVSPAATPFVLSHLVSIFHCCRFRRRRHTSVCCASSCFVSEIIGCSSFSLAVSFYPDGTQLLFKLVIRINFRLGFG